MTKALYLDNMNLKEFEATVESVKENKFIVLDQTAFYPKSGGVAFDTGKFVRAGDGEEFTVIFAGKFGKSISHEVIEEGLKVGDKIKGFLNWDRRYLLMRYHTAAHVLSGAFYKNLGAKITGNDISENQGRIDFNLENFQRELIEEQVVESNRIIQEDFPVEVYYLPRNEVESDTSLSKLVMGLPKNVDTIRIIDIKNFDRQPDGGCHVGSLKEVGEIQLEKLKNKGKNNRRLYFKLV